MNLNDDPLDAIPGPQGHLTLKVLADNRSVNCAGDVFGGWVAMHMDQAGEICARKESDGARIAVVSMGAMSFLRPVKVGNLLGFFTRVTEVGKTSIKIEVEAWIEGRNHWEKLTETSIVFVAIDQGGRTVRVRNHL